MDRRRFLLTSMAGALAAPFTAQAQQAGVMYRIGFLPFLACSIPEAFRSALNGRGFHVLVRQHVGVEFSGGG